MQQVIESKFIGCCKDGGAISTVRNGRPAGEQLNNQVRKGGHRSWPPFTTDIIAAANNSLPCPPLTQQSAQNRLPEAGSVLRGNIKRMSKVYQTILLHALLGSEERGGLVNWSSITDGV